MPCNVIGQIDAIPPPVHYLDGINTQNKCPFFESCHTKIQNKLLLFFCGVLCLLISKQYVSVACFLPADFPKGCITLLLVGVFGLPHCNVISAFTTFKGAANILGGSYHRSPAPQGGGAPPPTDRIQIRLMSICTALGPAPLQ